MSHCLENVTNVTINLCNVEDEVDNPSELDCEQSSGTKCDTKSTLQSEVTQIDKYMLFPPETALLDRHHSSNNINMLQPSERVYCRSSSTNLCRSSTSESPHLMGNIFSCYATQHPKYRASFQCDSVLDDDVDELIIEQKARAMLFASNQTSRTVITDVPLEAYRQHMSQINLRETTRAPHSPWNSSGQNLDEKIAKTSLHHDSLQHTSSWSKRKMLSTQKTYSLDSNTYISNGNISDPITDKAWVKPPAYSAIFAPTEGYANKSEEILRKTKHSFHRLTRHASDKVSKLTAGFGVQRKIFSTPASCKRKCLKSAESNETDGSKVAKVDDTIDLTHLQESAMSRTVEKATQMIQANDDGGGGGDDNGDDESQQSYSSLDGRTRSSNYLKEQFFHFFQPTDNKLGMKLFGTKMAVDRERKRQEQHGKWIIHPCSNFRWVSC